MEELTSATRIVANPQQPHIPLGFIHPEDGELIALSISEYPFRTYSGLKNQLSDWEYCREKDLPELDTLVDWIPLDVDPEMGQLMLSKNLAELHKTKSLLSSMESAINEIKGYVQISKNYDGASSNIRLLTPKLVSAISSLSSQFPKSLYLREKFEAIREAFELKEYDKHAFSKLAEYQLEALEMDFDLIDFRGGIDRNAMLNINKDNFDIVVLESGLSRDKFNEQFRKMAPKTFNKFYDIPTVQEKRANLSASLSR